MNYKTGLCTWSLQNDIERVTAVLQQTGLSCLHLDCTATDIFREAIQTNGWEITSTMLAFPQEDYSTLDSIRETGGIVPDHCWERNRMLALEAINTTANLKVGQLSFHAGFINHTNPQAYRTFCDRMVELADAAGAKNILLLLETGQERAEELSAFLDTIEHPALGVNFDPANMILYGKGDPTDAVKVLAPWIKHVHIKDAVESPVPGEWGQEVPWGEGQVDPAAFLQALKDIGFNGAVAIEREAGEQREQDIAAAAEQLKGIK
jgi:sugar phosphate isomerase/epimerase